MTAAVSRNRRKLLGQRKALVEAYVSDDIVWDRRGAQRFMNHTGRSFECLAPSGFLKELAVAYPRKCLGSLPKAWIDPEEWRLERV